MPQRTAVGNYAWVCARAQKAARCIMGINVVSILVVMRVNQRAVRFIQVEAVTEIQICIKRPTSVLLEKIVPPRWSLPHGKVRKRP